MTSIDAKIYEYFLNEYRYRCRICGELEGLIELNTIAPVDFNDVDIEERLDTAYRLKKKALDNYVRVMNIFSD